jgi:putative ATP-dependent endonuclease of the OLD family
MMTATRKPTVRLASLRLEGFRDVGVLEIDFDPVTVIVGEHGATKAALVDFLDGCLGPRSSEHPRFVVTDLPESDNGARGAIRARLRFLETVAGGWREGEPDLAAAAVRRRDGFSTLTFLIHAHARAGAVEGSLDVEASSRHPGKAAVERAWSRVRVLSPVLVVGADRSDRAEKPAASSNPAGSKRAEVVRLYRRLRDSGGRLSRQDLAAARTLLRDEMRLAQTDALFMADERPLVDFVDWQRLPSRDVIDDAVQDVLLRLVRAGLMVEAQQASRMEQDASPVVVVDSPDARLHPVLVARVWRFLHSVASQVIVTTNSADVVAASPLRSLRRLVRRDGGRVAVTRVVPAKFSIDDLRRVIYHVRLRRGSSLLARTWFLVEGETEVWLLQEFAAMLGYSFAAEGVACVEFAQCGLAPLLRLADQLGIAWHVLADGDQSGVAYAAQARGQLAGRSAATHVTALRAPDIEHVLWECGYADVFRRSANASSTAERPARAVIGRAIAKASKPLIAIRVIEQAAQQGSPGVPPALADAIRAAVALARRASKTA